MKRLTLTNSSSAMFKIWMGWHSDRRCFLTNIAQVAKTLPIKLWHDVKTITSPTDVIGEEIGRETLGPVAERCVIVRVASKDEQGAAEERSWVQVAWKAALSENEPGTCVWRQEQMWQVNIATHNVIRRTCSRVCVDLPCPGVNVIAVEVIDEAVFVGRQRLIPSVNIHTTAGNVVRAAVAVTSLRDGTFGLRH